METSYDLYHIIRQGDNPQSPEDITNKIYAIGYLAGYLDGLVIIQSMLFNAMFSPEKFKEEERNKLAKQVNFHRLNIPATGLASGQLMLIYRKFAEKYPEHLNESARVCLYGSIVEAYGWK